MGQDTKWKLTQRNGNWSACEVGGKRRRVSLGTKDKEVALVKMASELREVVLPKENQKHLALAKAHLKLVDPKMGGVLGATSMLHGLTRRGWGRAPLGAGREP